MKLFDKNTGVVIADIITNHGMTIDEALSLMRFSIGDEGQIFDDDNRFQRMKVTHPKQYAYCMDKLGLREVLEYIGVPYE